MITFLYLLQQQVEGDKFLGLEVSIWQLILIPVILALIEFGRYIYKSHIENKNNDENDIKKEEAEKSVGEIISKSFEVEKSELSKAFRLKENKYVLKLIKKHLELVRKKIEVDRLWVGKFHNGHDNETYPGDIFQLFSILEESLDYGVASQKKLFYNIPVAFYNVILEEVSENGVAYVEDINDIDKTLSLVMQMQGIKSMGVIGIFNESNELKGMLGYDFIRDRKNLTEEDIKHLKESGDLLLEYIKLYKIYEKSRVHR